MDEFSTEDEQLKELRNWWGENGRFVIAGLVVGIGLLAGWRAFQNYKIGRAEAGSDAYGQMIAALGDEDRDMAIRVGDSLTDEYADTPYADQAALALARFHMEQIEPEEASELLQRVADGSRDSELRDISRLRLARVRLDQERFDEALTQLDQVSTAVLQPRVSEIRGDIYYARGEFEQARSEYSAALIFTEPPVVDRNLLQMKLDDLAVAATLVDGDASDDAGNDEDIDQSPADDLENEPAITETGEEATTDS